MNSMELRPEQRLEEAILRAKSDGLRICRGAMMEWGADLVAVDAICAFVYKMRARKPTTLVVG